MLSILLHRRYIRCLYMWPEDISSSFAICVDQGSLVMAPCIACVRT